MENTVNFQTSGSTGTPKIITKTQASLDADATMLARVFAPLFADCPVAIATVSPQHMYGRLWLKTLFPKCGITSHPEQVTSWETFLDVQSTYDACLFVTTPSFLAEVVAHPHMVPKEHHIKAIFTSGSLLRPELSHRVFELFGVSPIEIYGSTETGSIAWRQQSKGEIWNVFDEVSLALADDGLAVTSPFCVTQPYVLKDAVTFLDETHRQFYYHGRLDRYVKILEHFVSLPEVESLLQRHEGVEMCHALVSSETIPRIWVLIVPSEKGRAELCDIGYNGFARNLRTFALKHGAREAVPRRFRFVSKLPYTTQGKLPQSAVLPYFQTQRQEPVVHVWHQTADCLEVQFTYPADALFFQGHFPEMSILPGVAQLFTLREFIHKAFGVWVDGTIKRLKFQQPILPRMCVTATITRKSPTTFAFEMQHQTGACASGILTTREEEAKS